jgi:hypothetical protein
MAPAPDIIALRYGTAGVFHRRRSRRASFVLVEVLLSLTILGIASMAFMKSFTYSLNAARKMEIITQATFFAHQLMDEFEINPPEEGVTEGNFGEDFPSFFYRVELEFVDPEYHDVDPPDDVARFFSERRLHIEIYYNDNVRKPYVAVDLDTALMGFEKFSNESKMSYFNY